jgi:hypothetical protein
MFKFGKSQEGGILWKKSTAITLILDTMKAQMMTTTTMTMMTMVMMNS